MQVPAPMEYERARSLENALELLESYGGQAKLVAGGHSLLPMMKLRIVQPEVVIDINDLDDLSFIKIEDNHFRIGAMVRHSELLSNPLIDKHFPIITDAEKVIADPIVRNRGTVGGSLCQADPSEDLAAVFSALKATLVIRGPKGERTVLATEFHDGPYATVLESNEILVEVRIPIIPGCGCAYEKVERRVGDYAIAAVGAVLHLDGDLIKSAGIGLTAVGSSHFNAPEAEEFLIGKVASTDIFAEAARIASQHCSPSTDQRGPVDYKRHLVEVLTMRALTRSRTRVIRGIN